MQRSTLESAESNTLVGSPDQSISARVESGNELPGEETVRQWRRGFATQLHDSDQVVRAERLAAIGHVFTVLAHESRNALQRSKAYLAELSDQLRDQPEILPLLEGVRRAQLEIERLFYDVRAYATPLRLDPERCNLAGICRQAWQNLDHTHHDRAVVFRVEENGCDTHCTVDYARIEQALRNLLENALSVGADPLAIQISFQSTVMGDRPGIRITVRDNGPGFSPEERIHIFEPFFTTRKNGTGLGMSIVKRIIEAHGGQVALGSGPGGEVFVALPCNESGEGAHGNHKLTSDDTRGD